MANKMILFFTAFSLIISFLIFAGAQARTLQGDASRNHHHELKLKAESGKYGREPYITTLPPASSPPNKQEIVGRHGRLLPPPAPKHDPITGELTTTTPDHDEVLIILLPTTTSSSVGGKHRHLHTPPPPKPADEQGPVRITSSSTTQHMNSNQHLPLQASY
ncbi:Hydroxyproline-rich systemin [Capsicum baccatum]|uniref:Hydroxyproline-rich systemin n=1 Tax=Capsicum baccatum TaxID=33114 RepID=A0A2G2WLB4_CAPBA|nr:Hydroxyproline-rich systemin [Capsicum baccatum]